MAYSGTSFAAPLVAGAVALLLQQDPSLDVDELKQLLYNMAKNDEFTGQVPNNTWGWGKLYLDTALIGIEIRIIGSNNQDIILVYPNPFNPTTRILYNLEPSQQGTIKIYDIRGKMVFERLIQGSGTIIWDAAGLGSGVYMLKVLSAGKIHSHKLVLQR